MKDVESSLHLRSNRKDIEAFLTEQGSEAWKFFSAPIYLQWKIMVEGFLPYYLRGVVLDDGCGRSPYLNEIKKHAETVILLDHSTSSKPLDVCSDVRLLPFPQGSFDTILSFQVLEHVANPFEAFQEIGRTLKPGGVLLLSVPHLSRLHELPHDYFRYTESGLRELANISGLEVVELVPLGGMIVFLSHQVSLAFVLGLWRFKVLRKAVFWLNKHLICRFSIWLDRYLGFPNLFPQGYAMVAKKK